jgi:hypothetical protein
LTPFVSGRQAVDIDLQELGVSPGSDLNQLEVQVSIDLAVRQTTPAGGPFSLLNVTDLDRLAWDTYDIQGEFDPGRPNGIKSNSVPIGTAAPRDLLPLQEDVNGCFPGSTARSLDWLNRRTHSSRSTKSIEDFYGDLKTQTGLPPNAPPREEERIEKKADYASDNLGVKTKVFDAINILDPIPGVPETTPAQMDPIEWLLQEFSKGEDIEIAYFWKNVVTGKTGAHIVAVVDIYKTAAGQTIVKYRDDEKQGNPAAGDNSVKWAELITKPDGTIGFRTGSNTLTYAVSESVPLPESVWMGLTLLGGFVAFRVWHNKLPAFFPQ